uniref:Uncharacterized protein n=1 Tax=Arundo donax TaxID=35708 RepID=A0A0A9NG80_ARUDO
MDGSKWSLW